MTFVHLVYNAEKINIYNEDGKIRMSFQAIDNDDVINKTVRMKQVISAKDEFIMHKTKTFILKQKYFVIISENAISIIEKAVAETRQVFCGKKLPKH